MCTTGQLTTPDAALAMLQAGLDALNAADVASLPAGALAGYLQALEQAGAKHTAARAGVLAAFTAQGGFEGDGQRGPQPWLRWRTRVTAGAAAGAVGWSKRLGAHPEVAREMAAGAISESWAKEICGWTSVLPAAGRDAADRILLDAAAGGADLGDLAGLAEEMRRRAAVPDKDGKSFEDRSLDLGVTLGGAGRVNGDLTPACTAALKAVLESLGKKTGPEDARTAAQRRHDALEQACQRLAAAGGLPDRAGQPTQVQLHLTLDQLRRLDGAADAEDTWAAGRAAGDGDGGGEAGWLTGRAAEGYACDADIAPMVTGHLDPAALARLAASLAGCLPAGWLPGPRGTQDLPPLGPKTLRRLHDTLLRHAADVLSGPAGLAAFLRTGLLAGEFPASVSLPLEAGAVTSTVPGHLRRAVIARDRHCAHPGCRARPAQCHVHHVKPRSKGGTTTLDNLILLCPFHHLIAVHEWGWKIILNADGTTTATSPDGKKALHSHSPPSTTVA